MLKSYKFQSQPVFSVDYQETTIQTEDFHKIMRLANSSLNCTCASSANIPHFSTVTKEASGSVHNHFHDQRQYIIPHVNNFPGSEPQPIQTQLSMLLSLEQKFGSQKLRAAANNNASPLSFLSSRLSQFTKATKLFSTRDHPTKTNVAKEFHEACDGKKNTLVIIKSGQYITGGYTEVAWSSPLLVPSVPLSSSSQAFLFSVTKQKVYPNIGKHCGIWCRDVYGPCFGGNGGGSDICVQGNYKRPDNLAHLGGNYSAEGALHPHDELFGTEKFTIDEYEVYKLE